MNTTFKDIMAHVAKNTTPNKIKSNEIITMIRNEVKQYVTDNKLQSLVMGISGGLDSSVVAALCQEKYTGVPLIGISIPMSSSTAHKEQAQWVGNNYCTAFEEFSGWDSSWELDGASTEGQGTQTNMVSEIFDTLKLTDKLAENAGFCPSTIPDKILSGNMKARLRMITLYDLARKTNGLVLSTDNRSEFFASFFTLHGDIGDLCPIQNIGKGFELPTIAESLGVRNDIIKQKPSDGLSVTEADTDEAQLGVNYQEFDTIICIYLGILPVSDDEKTRLKTQMFNLVETDVESAKKVAKVIARYESTSFKRRGAVNLEREDILLD